MPHQLRPQKPPASDRPSIRLERPPRGSVPELGIVLPPWDTDLPGMGIMFRRLAATMVVTVVAALILDRLVADPWPVIAIVAGTVAGLAWALRGAMPEIRSQLEENERAREAFLRARGRR